SSCRTCLSAHILTVQVGLIRRRGTGWGDLGDCVRQAILRRLEGGVGLLCVGRHALLQRRGGGRRYRKSRQDKQQHQADQQHRASLGISGHDTHWRFLNSMAVVKARRIRWSFTAARVELSPRLAMANCWLLAPLEALSGLEITRLSFTWLTCSRSVLLRSVAVIQRLWSPLRMP